MRPPRSLRTLVPGQPFGPRARDGAVALAVGAGHATWLFAATGLRIDGWPVAAWAAVGLALVGAAPALLALRRTLVGPAAAVVWLSVTAAAATPYGTPLGAVGFYALAWPLVLGAALVVGALEYGVRRWTGFARPTPLADL